MVFSWLGVINKNMRHFRKIIVDGVGYQWLFRYDDYDYINDPYLLIVKDTHPKATLKIIFRIKEHFLLCSGLPAKIQGREVGINLNQPGYISQIIQQCRKNGESFEQDGYRRLDGLELLKEIGYESVFFSEFQEQEGMEKAAVSEDIKEYASLRK